MRELTTCHYKLVVSTPRLCSEFAFVRQKSSMALKIRCSLPEGIVHGDVLDLENVDDALRMKRDSEIDSPGIVTVVQLVDVADVQV
jgi:hypothetical protein